jgi:hypothetical protein
LIYSSYQSRKMIVKKNRVKNSEAAAMTCKIMRVS